MSSLFRISLVLATFSLPFAAYAQDEPLDGEDGTDLEDEEREQAGSNGFSYDGSFLTRYELRTGYAALGSSRGRTLDGDAMAYRARIGVELPSLNVTDKTRARVRFVPQASGFTGEGTLTDSRLGVHEGYVRLDTGTTRYEIGRFIMNYGDGLVIGDFDWHETGRSFQGVRGSWQVSSPSWRLDAFLTQVAEGRSQGVLEPVGAGDQYFYGVYGAFRHSESDRLGLDAYAFGSTWPEAEIPVDPDDPAAGTATRAFATLITLGTRGKNDTGPMVYRFELGLQFGTALNDPGLDSKTTFAWHGDLELGIRIGELRLTVEGLVASGDNPETESLQGAWYPLFPSEHAFLGLSDAFGARQNLAGGAAHIAYRLGDTTAKLDGHVFSRLSPSVVDGPTGYAGLELDAQIVHALGKGLVARGVYGIFMPAEEIYGTTDPAHYLELGLRYEM